MLLREETIWNEWVESQQLCCSNAVPKMNPVERAPNVILVRELRTKS